MMAGARMQAKKAGEKTYVSERRCPAGHAGLRYVSNGSCAVCLGIRKAKYLAANGDRIKELDRARRRADPQKLKAQLREWAAHNRESRNASARAWRKKNPHYAKDRRQDDPTCRLRDALRNRFRAAFKVGAKGGSAIRDLGCTISELKARLESLFAEGMSWDNYGKWHIDHCRPLSSFDLSDPEQVKVACHWSNLQPLWAIDNLKKAASYAGGDCG